MILDDYNALSGLLEEFRQEEEETDIRIQNILRRIRESETYLKTIMGSEPDDYKVFSPRKAEVIYKEEIRKANEEIEELEGQNKELCGKRDVLYGRIHMIENIIGHYNPDSMAQKESEEDLWKSSMESLRRLADKIEISSAYIDRNPIQAKQDYIIISKCLQEIIDKIRSS